MAQRYQRQIQALGSAVWLTLVTEDNEASAAVLFDHLIGHIRRFEYRFSRFREDSELTTLNREAGGRAPITPALRKLLVTAKSYAERTHGLYNPFILPALQNAGYRSSWPQPNDATNIDFTDRHIVPIEDLHIGKDWARIPAGAALDFGGIGKGYVLDELAMWLHDKHLPGFWLSLGGDIICNGHDVDGNAWSIGVQAAHDPGRIVQTIICPAGTTLAVATSGTVKRRGTSAGVAWHHLIDPRTGKPADTTIATATVTAETATAADVYAKAVVIEGEHLAQHYKKIGSIFKCILQTTEDMPIIDI